MAVDVVVGLQRGDEGKGRFVDMMAVDHDIVVKFNGAHNAGHTVALEDGRILKLHLLPSGIAHEHTVNVIGNGTFVSPVDLVREIAETESQDIEVSPQNLKISSGAQLIFPHHIYLDELREGTDHRQGSTKSGVAQVAASKALREGARLEIINNEPDKLINMVYEGLEAVLPLIKASDIEDIDIDEIVQNYMRCARQLGVFITDTVIYLKNQLTKEEPATVLAEGAQAFLLDIDHGMAPFTTSSSATTGGVCTGLGVPPQAIGQVTGVVKAVQSHVGGGPFVTEISDPELLAKLHGDMTTVDAERGTTTGRIRRIGHLDLPQIRRANWVNGVERIALSKLDWVPRYGEQVLICTAYERKGKTLELSPDSARKLEQSTPIYEALPTWSEDIQGIRDFNDLPEAAQNYIDFFEEQTGVEISMIGVGPRRDQVIDRR